MQLIIKIKINLILWERINKMGTCYGKPQKELDFHIASKILFYQINK